MNTIGLSSADISGVDGQTRFHSAGMCGVCSPLACIPPCTQMLLEHQNLVCLPGSRGAHVLFREEVLQDTPLLQEVERKGRNGKERSCREAKKVNGSIRCNRKAATDVQSHMILPLVQESKQLRKSWK